MIILRLPFCYRQNDMQTDEMRFALTPSPARLMAVIAILFTAYQLPEGRGMRVLHSFPVQAVLMLSFLPIVWLCGALARVSRGRCVVHGLRLARSTSYLRGGGWQRARDAGVHVRSVALPVASNLVAQGLELCGPVRRQAGRNRGARAVARPVAVGRRAPGRWEWSWSPLAASC
jgi:hypothetical protein